MPAGSQRSLHLKVRQEPVVSEGSSAEPRNSCPYCVAQMPVEAIVCQVCRRTLPEIILFRTKVVVLFIGLACFFVLAVERFYRLQSGDIFWLKFNPTPAKYLEWLIADPGPFILGVFICGYALDYYRRKLRNLASREVSI